MMTRLRLAWRQLLAGLRGRDLQTELDTLDRCLRNAQQLVHDFHRRIHSKRKRVVQIEHVDYGIDQNPHLPDVLLYEIKATSFDVPEALCEQVMPPLLTRYRIDKALVAMMREPETEIDCVRHRAAAQMGVALVFGCDAANGIVVGSTPYPKGSTVGLDPGRRSASP